MPGQGKKICIVCIIKCVFIINMNEQQWIIFILQTKVAALLYVIHVPFQLSGHSWHIHSVDTKIQRGKAQIFGLSVSTGQKHTDSAGHNFRKEPTAVFSKSVQGEL